MSGDVFESGIVSASRSARSRRSSSARSIQKKMPQSETQVAVHADRQSVATDDLTFMRLPTVKALTGLSKTSIYELIREKNFPSPVRLGPRAVAWIRSEVRQWAVERVNASRSVA